MEPLISAWKGAMLLQVLLFCLTAVQGGILTSCAWKYPAGGWGTHLGCPLNDLTMGMCTSGENADCDGNALALKCCKDPDGFTATYPATAAVKNADYGQRIKCEPWEGSVTSICASGRNKDCQGYSHRITCGGRTNFDPNGCTWTIANGWNEKLECADENKILVGICASGANMDCAGSGSNKPKEMLCCPIKCNPPAAPAYGSYSGAAAYYANPAPTATLTCDAGYTRIEPSVATCARDGKWRNIGRCFQNCASGLKANPEYTQCLDKNECTENTHACHAASTDCVNNYGGYYCTCKTYFKYNNTAGGVLEPGTQCSYDSSSLVFSISASNNELYIDLAGNSGPSKYRVELSQWDVTKTIASRLQGYPKEVPLAVPSLHMQHLPAGKFYLVTVDAYISNTWAPNAIYTTASTKCGCDKTTLTSTAEPTGAPIDVTAVQTYGQVRVKWTDNSLCETAFSFFRIVTGQTAETSFNDDYMYISPNECKTVHTPDFVKDDIELSDLKLGTQYTYCVRAVASGEGGTQSYNSDPGCAVPLQIGWESVIKGRFTLPAEAGGLPVDDVQVHWTAVGGANQNISGQVFSAADGKFEIHILTDVITTETATVTLTFRKNTGGVEHLFLCDGVNQCTSKQIAIRHLTFDNYVAVIDDTSVPFTGRVGIQGTEYPTDNNCPVYQARVCLRDFKTDAEYVCVETNAKGEYEAPAVLGLTVKAAVKYKQHTFNPVNPAAHSNGFYIEAKTFWRNIDFVDNTTEQLTIEVVGGKCNRRLGFSEMQLGIESCPGWTRKLTLGNIRSQLSVPAHELDVKLVAVFDDAQNQLGEITAYFGAKLGSRRVIKIDLTEIKKENEKKTQAKADLQASTDAQGTPTTQATPAATSVDNPALVRFEYHPQPQLSIEFKGSPSGPMCGSPPEPPYVLPANVFTKATVKIKEVFGPNVLDCDWIDGSVLITNQLGEKDNVVAQLRAQQILPEDQLAGLSVCRSPCRLDVQHLTPSAAPKPSIECGEWKLVASTWNPFTGAQSEIPPVGDDFAAAGQFKALKDEVPHSQVYMECGTSEPPAGGAETEAVQTSQMMQVFDFVPSKQTRYSYLSQYAVNFENFPFNYHDTECGLYHFAPQYSGVCDYGINPPFEECERANAWLGRFYGRTPKRPMASGYDPSCGPGSWNAVAGGCNSQTGDDVAVVNQSADFTAHWQEDLDKTCQENYYRKICDDRGNGSAFKCDLLSFANSFFLYFGLLGGSPPPSMIFSAVPGQTQCGDGVKPGTWARVWVRNTVKNISQDMMVPDETQCRGASLRQVTSATGGGNPYGAHVELNLFTGLPEENAQILDADHPHTKLFKASMAVLYQPVALNVAKVVITGDKLISDFFSVPIPEYQPLLVLRDPPGGLSVAEYSKVQTTLEITVQDHQAYNGLYTTDSIGTTFGDLTIQDCIGAGAGAGGLGPLVFTSVAICKTDAEAGNEIALEYDDGELWRSKYEHKEQSASLTVQWSYATSDDPARPGKLSDMFLVPSLNIVWREVLVVSYNASSCRGQSKTLLKYSITKGAGSRNRDVFAWLSYHDIKTKELPRLRKLLLDAQSKNDAEAVAKFQEGIDGWNATLARHDSISQLAAAGNLTKADKLAPKYFIDRARHFDGVLANDKDKGDLEAINVFKFEGGGSLLSYSVSQDSSTSSTGDSEAMHTGEHKIGGAVKTSLKTPIGGIDLDLKLGSHHTNSDESTFTHASSGPEDGSIGFTLGDPDSGDIFDVEVFIDPVYNTFVFHTTSGYSKCPGEVNTVHREQPAMVLLRAPTVPVLPSESAIFEVRLGNNGEEAVDYELYLENADNEYGLEILVSKYDLPRKYEGVPGKSAITAIVTINRGPELYKYDKPITLGWRSFCESDTYGGDSSNLPPDDWAVSTVNLTVEYVEPCNTVQFAGALKDERSWVINMAAEERENRPGQLRVLAFNPEAGTRPWNDKTASDRLERVSLEYQPAGGQWTPCQNASNKVINAWDFESSFGYATLWWAPNALPEGEYELRMHTICTPAPGGGSDPPPGLDEAFSEVVGGVIDRTPPAPFGLPEPADGEFFPGDNLGVGFTEAVRCTKPYSFSARVLVDNVTQVLDHRSMQVLCEGRQIRFALPLTLPFTEISGKDAELRVLNVEDLSGNTIAHPVSYKFKFAKINRNKAAVGVTGLVVQTPYNESMQDVDTSAFKELASKLVQEISAFTEVSAERIRITGLSPYNDAKHNATWVLVSFNIKAPSDYSDKAVNAVSAAQALKSAIEDGTVTGALLRTAVGSSSPLEIDVKPSSEDHAISNQNKQPCTADTCAEVKAKIQGDLDVMSDEDKEQITQQARAQFAAKLGVNENEIDIKLTKGSIIITAIIRANPEASIEDIQGKAQDIKANQLEFTDAKGTVYVPESVEAVQPMTPQSMYQSLLDNAATDPLSAVSVALLVILLLVVLCGFWLNNRALNRAFKYQKINQNEPSANRESGVEIPINEGGPTDPDLPTPAA
eukprot:g76968.t1